MISYDLYRVFWTIGKTGNLTRAAEQLFVTQPNVSQALKTLEDQLGVTLCRRSRRGVSLTYEGETLFREIDLAVSHIQAGERTLDSLIHMNSGVVSVSAGDTVCQYFLLPFIRSFRELYPGIRLEITNRTSSETLELVKSRRADLGFVNVPAPDPLLSFRTCLSVRDVLIGGTEYRYLADAPLSPEQCLSHPLILLETKSSGRRFLDRFFLSRGLSPAPILELGSVDLIIGFVRSNFGLAFIPDELCGHLIDGETVFRIPMSEPVPLRELAIVEHREQVMSHAAQVFKRHILENSGKT